MQPAHLHTPMRRSDATTCLRGESREKAAGPVRPAREAASIKRMSSPSRNNSGMEAAARARREKSGKRRRVRKPCAGESNGYCCQFTRCKIIHDSIEVTYSRSGKGCGLLAAQAIVALAKSELAGPQHSKRSQHYWAGWPPTRTRRADRATLLLFVLQPTIGVGKTALCHHQQVGGCSRLDCALAAPRQHAAAANRNVLAAEAIDAGFAPLRRSTSMQCLRFSSFRVYIASVCRDQTL